MDIKTDSFKKHEVISCLVFLVVFCFSGEREALAQARKDDYVSYGTLDRDFNVTMDPNKKFGFTRFWALENDVEKPVVPYKYDWASVMDKGKASVKLNGKYGVIDSIGKAVIPMLYDNELIFDNGAATAVKDGVYGVIDKSGKVLVPFDYEFISTAITNKGTVSAVKAGKWGVISFANAIVVSFNYKAQLQDDDGDFVGQTFDGQLHYFSPSGKQLTIPDAKRYEEIAPGFYKVVNKQGLTAIINDNQEFVLPFEKQSIYAPNKSASIVEVVKSRKHGVYNIKTQKWILSQNYDDISIPKNGATILATEKRADENQDGVYEFYNAAGDKLFNQQYQDAKPFDDFKDLAIVKLNGKWGVIDPNGKVILPFEIAESDDITLTVDKHIIANKAGKWGVITSTGRSVIPFAYTGRFFDQSPFSTSWESTTYFVVRKGELWGVVSRTGKLVVPLEEYEALWVDKDEPTRGAIREYCFAYKNKKWGCTDLQTGQQVLPFEYNPNQAAQIPDIRSSKKYDGVKTYIRNINKSGYEAGLYLIDDKKLFNSKDYSFEEYVYEADAFIVARGEPDNRQYALVDGSGKRVTGFDYKNLTYGNEGLFYALTLNNKVGFIDKSGQVAIDFAYEPHMVGSIVDEDDFYRGYTSLKKAGHDVMLDNRGKKIATSMLDASMDATYAYMPFGTTSVVTSYGDGVRKYLLNGKVYEDGANINQQGEAVSPKWSNVFADYSFYLELIAAKQGGKYGYLDYNGREVIPFEYDMASNFGGSGYAYVKKDGEYFLINTKGKRLAFDNVFLQRLRQQ